MRVLIVDDDRLIRKMMRAVLEAEGLECHEASTAAEAMARLRDVPPDVCFLDHVLPDADGLTLLQLIGATPGLLAPPRVYLVTGSDEPGLARKAMELGARGLLSKPVPPEVLIKRAREA